jgi:hypothetical protein
MRFCDEKGQRTFIPAESTKMKVSPGVGSDLVTIIVSIFDIIDHILVVNTAVYSAASEV